MSDTWAIKFAAGLGLFACMMRLDYLQHGAQALAPRRFAAVALIFALAVYACFFR